MAIPLKGSDVITPKSLLQKVFSYFFRLHRLDLLIFFIFTVLAKSKIFPTL